MKNPIRSSSKQGFTLVELLVVIAIIAVLAAAGFAAGNAALQKARQVSAQAAATSIVTAVDQFYTEYSALPDPSGDSTEDVAIDSDTTNGATLLQILMGKETPADQNDRSINFLSLPEAKGGESSYKNGVYYATGSTSPSGLRDPWGLAYTIVLDLDYDDQVTPTLPNGITSKALNSRKVAVFSAGTRNVGDASAKTLVKTW
ncbi:MAG: prepilin-type N-terminal cleavage/methylation domain-containing protein [Luteolibacter sp.]